MTYKLITAVATEPVSVVEAKLHLRVDDSADDARIGTMITAARQRAEQITGRLFGGQTWELVLDAFPSAFEITNAPIASVTSIKYIDAAGVEQTLSAAAYVVDADSVPARITLAEGYDWPETQSITNAVRVRYVAGHGATEAELAALKQWMLIAVGTWYRHAEAVYAGSLSALPRTYVDGLLDRYRTNFI